MYPNRNQRTFPLEHRFINGTGNPVVVVLQRDWGSKCDRSSFYLKFKQILQFIGAPDKPSVVVSIVTFPADELGKTVIDGYNHIADSQLPHTPHSLRMGLETDKAFIKS